MFHRSALCLLVALMTGALAPGDAAAQYGSGGGGGYYGGRSYGGGGGYHSEAPPRRERQGQSWGGQRSNGAQCYTRRSKGQNGQWESQKVCE